MVHHEDEVIDVPDALVTDEIVSINTMNPRMRIA